MPLENQQASTKAPGKPYGLIAEFETPAQVLRAAEAVRVAGFHKWDAFTPFPVQGLDHAMGLQKSNVGWFAFAGGLAGLLIGMALVWFTNARDYPIIVGGKPMFSPFSAFPVAFELAVLFAALGTVFGMLFLNHLPRLHHPLLKNRRFAAGATRDKFFVVIECADPHYREKETRQLLQTAGSKHIERVEE